MTDYKSLLELLSKEDSLSIRRKMDATNLTGVWPDMPGGAAPSGRGRFYAGVRLYLEMLEQEQMRRRKRRKKETPQETHRRLLDLVIEKLEQEDSDDLAVLLTL